MERIREEILSDAIKTAIENEARAEEYKSLALGLLISNVITIIALVSLWLGA